MYLSKLILYNFKNYTETEVDFSSKVNCLVGQNGAGKTNMLDAIHFLSMTKSAFNTIDSQNIRHDSPFFAITGSFIKHQAEEVFEVICSYQKGKSKAVKLNKVEYDKLSNHIGLFPVVLVSPNDTDLIRDGNEIRRKFMDGIIAQTSSEYLKALIRYTHYLKQRNAVLKSFFETKVRDLDLLYPYDKALLETGAQLFKARSAFMDVFLPVFLQHYERISGSKELVEVVYKSQFQSEGIAKKFSDSLDRDILLQRTNIGIHKDEIVFSIQGQPLKKFGSQGQQKSFAIALKLAQFDIIHNSNAIKPILLLDDLFDKLDDMRIAHLLKMVNEEHFGQIFITDARPERTKNLLKLNKSTAKFFNVENGKLKELVE